MTDEHAAREEAGVEGAQPQQALVPVKRAQLEVSTDQGYIRPSTIEEVVRLARVVIHGRLAPNSYNDNEGMITLGIMAALEAGLPPLYGLRQIAIIQGRPVIWGDAALALVQSKNLIEEYVATPVGEIPQEKDLTKWPDSFGYHVKIKRRNTAGYYEHTFTVGDARRAHLWAGTFTGKPKVPWLEHPLRMLLIRARAFPLRDGFADGLAGLAIREEVEDTFGDEPKAPVEMQLTNQPLVEAPPLPEEEEKEA